MSNKYHHQSCAGFEAKAPYNFVPLPERVFHYPESLPGQDRYHTDLHTGYIDLTIMTETPLYTRCAYPPSVAVDEEGKPDVNATPECQNFFHDGDTEIPVIPGSSLRGMVRTLVEILSYSKVTGDFDKHFFHRGVGDQSSMGSKYRDKMLGANQDRLPKMKFEYPVSNLRGGYLVMKSSEHSIRPAVMHQGESFVHVEYSAFEKEFPAYPKGVTQVCFDVWVKPEPRTLPPRRNPNLALHFAITKQISNRPLAGLKQAKLVVSGHMSGRIEKHMHCAIYEPDSDDSKLIPITDEQWKLYEEDLGLTRGDDTRTRPLSDGDALFYLMKKAAIGREELEFFGSTMMFRLPYPHDLQVCAPKHDDQLDLAESVFGVVRKGTKETIAGRVFFTDALWDKNGDDPFLGGEHGGRRIPKILSSPKLTSFQLYLNQPDVAIRSKRNRTGQPESVQNGETLKSYYDNGATAIRGFKLYWHKKFLLNTLERFKDLDARITDGGIEHFKPSINGTDTHRNRRGDWHTSSQHTIIRPVRGGVTFRGRVYFENLSKLELGGLLTTLNLPSSKRCRLGMGKPYGLGTVRIEPELVLEERTPQVDNKGRYDKLFANEQEWHEGRKSIEEASGVAANCINEFRTTIVAHYNSAVREGSKVREDASLDEVPRLNALYTMLEWDNSVTDERRIEYLGLDTKPQQEEWRKRHVLPYPQIVAGGQAPPAVERADDSPLPQERSSFPVAPTKPAQSNASSDRGAPSVASQDADARAAENIRRMVNALRGPGEVSSVSGIVGKIENLINPSLKVECARQMKLWLDRHKLWNSPKHAERDWRKKLSAILGES